jgi:hypothetical protein
MSALLSFDPELHRPLVDLVIATLWADGQVADREIAAARGAQIALGLVHDSGDESTALIARGPSARWQTIARAPEGTRVIAYAAAVWTALADGRMDPGERAFLREVAAAFALDEHAIRFGDAIARWIAAAAREERLEPYRAFARLLVQGARRVASIRARRLEAA